MEVTSHFHRLGIWVDKIGTNQLFMVEVVSSKRRIVSLYLCLFKQESGKDSPYFLSFLEDRKMANCEKSIFFH